MFYNSKNFGKIEYIETNYSRFIEKIKNKNGRFNIFYENREEAWNARITDVNICFFDKKMYFYKNDVFIENKNNFDYFYFVEKNDDLFMDTNKCCFERKEDTFCYNMDTIIINNYLTLTIVYNDSCDPLESKIKNVSKKEDEPLFNFIEKDVHPSKVKEILAKYNKEYISRKVFDIKNKDNKYLYIGNFKSPFLWYSKLDNTYIYKRRYPILATNKEIDSHDANIINFSKNNINSAKTNREPLSSDIDIFGFEIVECDDIPF